MITAKCTCGKRTIVSDAMAGKSIRCTGCGQSVEVGGAVATAVASEPARKGSAKSGPAKSKPSREMPAIHISNRMIAYLVVVVLLVGGGSTFYFGPIRVWHQWEDVAPKAQSNVNDVLNFALQAYLSANGAYDPTESHLSPTVEPDNIQFFRPTFVMSMPDKVKFQGRSNQGPFAGTYDINSGEVEADMAFGGVSVAGTVDIRKATNVFHFTGRIVDGVPQAESNGQSLKIRSWKDK